MATYYSGDLDSDLSQIANNQIESEAAEVLDEIGKQIGYGRAQQILQVLWAKMLCEKGLPTAGALL